PLGAALNSYQDLAAAQGEIASLGIGDKGINAITKSAMQFSNQFAGTTAPDFIKASYDIKSGISSLSDTAVGEFTKLAAMTGAATKSSTSEMTSLFASGFGIYRQQFESFGASTIEGWNKLSAEEKDVKFGEYFSAGISSAVQAFKTDGANMSAAISNLGAAATSANVPFAEQLSILGMLQKTMSGSEAATKYRAFLDGAVKASDKLGLSFMDSNNQLLSMPEIIGQIRDKYGETIDALESDELKKAFGTEEAVALVKLLYGETDTLTSSINEMGTSLKSGTTKTEAMAKAMNKGKEFELLSQKMGNLSSLIGQTFAPIALKLGEFIGGVVSKASTWIENNKELAGTIGTVIAYAGGILTVLGTVAISVGAVTMALPALATALTVTSTAFSFLGTVMGVVGKIFLMNPIGRIATAIATAAYLIYDNWGAVKGFFIDMWDGIKSIFSSAINVIKKYFGWTPLGMILNNWGVISTFFSELWSGVVTTFGNAWENIKSSFNGVVDYIKRPFEAFFGWIASKFEWITNSIGVVVDKVSSIGDSISDTVSGIGDTIGDGLKTASNWFKFGDDQEKTTIATMNKNINYTQMPKLNTPGVKGVNQNNNIQVTVNNPTSNVDVQKAVVNAMANNRGLSDENL
ncbi:MAG: phage tail tape measure protein, partial [Campylobacterales bacterium]|nr:phage tail tape measure protein [Campylobacterales bacterium]